MRDYSENAVNDKPLVIRQCLVKSSGDNASAEVHSCSCDLRLGSAIYFGIANAQCGRQQQEPEAGCHTQARSR